MKKFNTYIQYQCVVLKYAIQYENHHINIHMRSLGKMVYMRAKKMTLDSEYFVVDDDTWKNK